MFCNIFGIIMTFLKSSTLLFHSDLDLAFCIFYIYDNPSISSSLPFHCHPNLLFCLISNYP